MDVKDDEITLAMDEPNQDIEVDTPRFQHEAAPEEPEPEAKDAQPRSPDGKFASKKGDENTAETAAEAPPAPEPESPTVPRTALQDERRKRQELEQQLAAFQRQQVQQPQETKQPPPAFWDDPDRALEARMEQFGSQLLQRFQQQQTMERITASEAQAKAKHADWDDAFRSFQQAASANPLLVQQMTLASDPGEFAYSTGKRAMDLERVGSFEELLKAERAKWEAEVKAAVPQTRPSFPTSTVADGSVAARGGPVWSGPVADKDILPMG